MPPADIKKRRSPAERAGDTIDSRGHCKGCGRPDASTEAGAARGCNACTFRVRVRWEAGLSPDARRWLRFGPPPERPDPIDSPHRQDTPCPHALRGGCRRHNPGNPCEACADHAAWRLAKWVASLAGFDLFWGPSPTGRAAQQAEAYGISSKARHLHTGDAGRKRPLEAMPAGDRLRTLVSRFGGKSAGWREPSPDYPNGRMWLGMIRRQYPREFAAVAKELSEKQLAALAMYHSGKTLEQIAAALGARDASSPCRLLVRAADVFRRHGLPDPLPIHEDRRPRPEWSLPIAV